MLEYNHSKIVKKDKIAKIILSIFIFFAILIAVFTFFISEKKIIIPKIVNYLINTEHPLSAKTLSTSISSSLGKIAIDSQTLQVEKTGIFNFLNCYIKIPNIRKKSYEGPTKSLLVNDKKKLFNFPNRLLLQVKNNKENYIDFAELSGNFELSPLKTKGPFKINDNDIFISGNSLIFNNSTKNLQIFDKVIIIKTKNNEKKIVNSEYLSAIFQKNSELKNCFLAKNVIFKTGKSDIKSDYAYYDSEKKLAILYQNVNSQDEKKISNGLIYTYNIDLQTGKIHSNEENLNPIEKKSLQELKNQISKIPSKYQSKIIKNNDKRLEIILNLKNEKNK